MEVSGHIQGPVAFYLQVKDFCFRREKSLLPLLGFEPRIVQPITFSLCRLRYPDF
jgi:hypothetical protein